jgi:hypothetical protein
MFLIYLEAPSESERHLHGGRFRLCVGYSPKPEPSQNKRACILGMSFTHGLLPLGKHWVNVIMRSSWWRVLMLTP